MAQTQIYTRKAQVHLIEEATQYLYIAPQDLDTGFFLADIPDVPLTIDSTNSPAPAVREDLLMMDEVPGSVAATINFRVPLKGSGTAGTAPECEEAIKACGLIATNVVSTSDTYSPFSVYDGAGGNPGQSYSVSVLEGGVRYAIAGAFGNMVINATVGEPAYMEFTFTGAYQAVADDALEAPTYQTTSPPAFMGGTVAVHGGTPKAITSLSYDFGAQLSIVRDVNATYGVRGSVIGGRVGTGTIEFEMQTVAGFDWFDKWLSGPVAGSVTTGNIGSAGNQWSLSINRANMRPPTLVNREGVRAISMGFAAAALATGNDGSDVDLVFT